MPDILGGAYYAPEEATPETGSSQSWVQKTAGVLGDVAGALWDTTKTVLADVADIFIWRPSGATSAQYTQTPQQTPWPVSEILRGAYYAPSQAVSAPPRSRILYPTQAAGTEGQGGMTWLYVGIGGFLLLLLFGLRK